MFVRMSNGALYEVGRDSETGALYYRTFNAQPRQAGEQNSEVQGGFIRMALNGTITITSFSFQIPTYSPTIQITPLDPLDAATLISGPPAGMEEAGSDAPTMLFTRGQGQASAQTLLMGSGHLRQR